MSAYNLIGQTLDGKYSIQKEIGRGGMGAVYFAVHLGTKRPVAVKVIVPQYMQHTEFVERFKREAEAAGRLHHPNVVDVTDFGFAQTAAGRVAYLVMEYLEGYTLADVLAKEKKLSLSWTVDIIEQVCLAVAEAHRLGIVHRDLKPDNIWLAPNERGGYTVKVLDFGIAKLETQSKEFNTEDRKINFPANYSKTAYLPADGQIPTEAFSENDSQSFKSGFETFIENKAGSTNFKQSTASPTVAMNPVNQVPPTQRETIADLKAAQPVPNPVATNDKNPYERTTVELTRVGALMGTPLYMSPEQCRAERLGTSSDIYSLGIITYQMLSGKTPFQGEHISVISGHLQLSPPPLRPLKIPRKVKKVIYGALSKLPIDRPPTAEIFSSQLRSHSENIFSIFKRALVIYIENFSKLIWFSLLLYFPTILLAAATLFINVLKFNGFFSANLPATISTVLLSLIKHANIAAGICGETLITGAVTWIVVQYIDAPLRSFRVTRALGALTEKWRQFAWILPLRVFVNLLIQGDFTGFSAPIMLLLSALDSLIFWSLPCVVMMEKQNGFAALKRGWQLTRKAISTVLATIVINLMIFSVIGVSMSIIMLSFAAAISQSFFPSVAGLSLDEFTNLAEGAVLTAVKLAGVFLLPFFGVVTALIYLKTRLAGGESMKVLLEKFKNAKILRNVR